MIIALDYDGTYTLDPEFWLAFVERATSSGHEVFCCTMRTPGEVSGMDQRLRDLVQVIPTSRGAKRAFLGSMGVEVDVWIDDNPAFILSNSADYAAGSASLPDSGQPKAKARLVLRKPA